MKMTDVRAQLDVLGMTIRKVDGEYRVAFKGPHSEASAYYTDDLSDAYGTAVAMKADSIA